MIAEVDTKELDKLIANLRSSDEKAKKILWEEVSLSAINIESEAKKRCPVKTGRLRASIAALRDEKSISAAVYTNVEYSADVELGTAERRATPYLFPAYNVEMVSLLKRLKERLHAE